VSSLRVAFQSCRCCLLDLLTPVSNLAEFYHSDSPPSRLAKVLQASLTLGRVYSFDCLPVIRKAFSAIGSLLKQAAQEFQDGDTFEVGKFTCVKEDAVANRAFLENEVRLLRIARDEHLGLTPGAVQFARFR
jgi:hypothetical protein